MMKPETASTFLVPNLSDALPHTGMQRYFTRIEEPETIVNCIYEKFRSLSM
jgi:hypothetical protein